MGNRLHSLLFQGEIALVINNIPELIYRAQAVLLPLLLIPLVGTAYSKNVEEPNSLQSNSIIRLNPTYPGYSAQHNAVLHPEYLDRGGHCCCPSTSRLQQTFTIGFGARMSVRWNCDLQQVGARPSRLPTDKGGPMLLGHRYSNNLHGLQRDQLLLQCVAGNQR